jgi:Na+-driven multidrug efflux pump
LWLLPGIVAFSVVNVLAAYLAGTGKPRLNLMVSSIALIVTVVLDLLLIPRLNIVGASIASTASYSLGAILTVALFIRQTGTAPREVLLPTKEDLRLLFSLARPWLRRAGLQWA